MNLNLNELLQEHQLSVRYVSHWKENLIEYKHARDYKMAAREYKPPPADKTESAANYEPESKNELEKQLQAT